MSKHARVRLKQMQVDREEVRAVLVAPDAVYRGRKEAGWIHQRGDLAAVATYEPDRNRYVVHTLLWRTDEDYERAES